MAFAELWCVFPRSRHLRQGFWGAGEKRRPGLRVYRRRQDQAWRPGEEDPRVRILHGETSPPNKVKILSNVSGEFSVADAGAPTSALLSRGLDVPTTQSPLRSWRSAIQTTRWPGTTKDIEPRSQKPLLELFSRSLFTDSNWRCSCDPKAKRSDCHCCQEAPSSISSASPWRSRLSSESPEVCWRTWSDRRVHAGNQWPVIIIIWSSLVNAKHIFYVLSYQCNILSSY